MLHSKMSQIPTPLLTLPNAVFLGPTSPPPTIANVIFGASLNSFFRLQGDFVLRVRGADTDAAGEAGVQFNRHFEFWVQKTGTSYGTTT